jgi:NADH-quinone oxidoreductase subunit F
MKKLSNTEDLESYRASILAKENLKKIRVRICMTGCRAYGAKEIKSGLEEEISAKGLDDKVEIISTGCHGFCARAPVMTIDPEDIFYQQVSPQAIPEIVSQTLKKRKIVEPLLYNDPSTGKRIVHSRDVPFYKKQTKNILRNCGRIDPTNISHYIARDGYIALGKVLSLGDPAGIIEMVKKSDLRGRGGAGFPTGLKWSFTRAAKGSPKYFICNADEGDPGAFMDRALLEGDPHSVLEGMAIGGYAIGAEHGYIYVRAEYPIAVEHLKVAIRQAEELGFLGEDILGSGFTFDVRIKQGAGAFVCGEETALIASLEGKRGMPRPRPPFPAQSGLWGRPTCINNVETLANVPYIFLKGTDEYAKIGTDKSKGTKIFALAGKINNTGLVEVPMGTTLKEVVFDIGGGVAKGRKFKAVQIGGPSGGCIPERYLDLPIDYDSLKGAGAIMGSGGMVVMDDNTCMVDIARFFLEFVQDESCGKCVPCRIGTKRMLEILMRITQGEGEAEDIEWLEELARMVKDSSLCGLGQTAPNPVLSTLRYFLDEYRSHVEEKYCPACSCEALFISPCQHACPLGINVHGYVELITQNRFEEALALIEEKNPFPAVCGRVCHRPCEAKCRRGEIDEPVAIDALKRFVSDYVPKEKKRISPPSVRKEEKVAIIGSGPAGLTAAHYLARWGYKVTVFETLPWAGGMLRVGIPDYRLPKKILEEEIVAVVKNLGVEIRTNVCVGQDLPFEHIFPSDYRAVFIATGCHKSRKLGILGEDLKDVFSGLGFLKRVNSGESLDLGAKSVVVGGGNAAVDAARSALRMGVKEVRVLYRRGRQEMPAIESEVEAAEKEGVEINYLVAPVRILNRDGGVCGLECIRMRLGEYDSSGRRRPLPIRGSEFVIEADSIISAVGQSADLSFLPSSLTANKGGSLWVDPYTLATKKPGIFAGGDLITGPATVVEAMAAGRRVAISIHRYLRGEPLQRVPILEKKQPSEIEGAAIEEPLEKPRLPMPVLPLEERIKSFQEIEQGFSCDMAIEEAKRCLKCHLEQQARQ